MIELPKDAQERKDVPIWTAFVKYFPNAIAAVAKHAANGSKQHHPDDEPWWDMSKSQDEMDALMRHALEGHHEAVAWRAMANLEREILNGYKANEEALNFSEGTDEDDLFRKPLSFETWREGLGYEESSHPDYDYNLRGMCYGHSSVYGMYKEYLDARLNNDGKSTKVDES